MRIAQHLDARAALGMQGEVLGEVADPDDGGQAWSTELTRSWV